MLAMKYGKYIISPSLLILHHEFHLVPLMVYIYMQSVHHLLSLIMYYLVIGLVLLLLNLSIYYMFLFHPLFNTYAYLIFASQFWNAATPMLVTSSGNVILVIFSQPLNAPSHIVVSFVITTVVNVDGM